MAPVLFESNDGNKKAVLRDDVGRYQTVRATRADQTLKFVIVAVLQKLSVKNKSFQECFLLNPL
jgi:hypothetical protein